MPMPLSSGDVKSALPDAPRGVRVPYSATPSLHRRSGRLFLALPIVPFLALAAACSFDAPSPPTHGDQLPPETVEVRRRLFEIGSDAPVVIEGLVAGNEDAEVIVLLTEAGWSASRFLEFMPRLVEAGYRAVALNPRGIDGSRGPLGDLTLHDFASDVAGVIGLLNRGPVYVLGHGHGNRVARCLAADRPDLVSGLILLGAGGQVPGDAEALEALSRLTQPGQADDERRADLQMALFAPTSDAAQWLDLSLSAEVLRAQGGADRVTPREEWLTGGNAPMLVIQGRHDRVAPPANGRWLRERFRERVQLVELANSGHALLPEEPGEIVEAIERFTTGLERPPTND